MAGIVWEIRPVWGLVILNNECRFGCGSLFSPRRRTTMPETTAQPDPQPRRVLITAGPTHEAIDAVRYLANRSSGQMGVALAEAASRSGWTTTLLLGPVPRTPEFSTAVRVLRFQSTADLQALLAEHWPNYDLLIMAAAVADYRPAGGPSLGKLARNDGNRTLELEATPDLLAEIASMSRPGQALIGFALAPAEQLDESAQMKLKSKSINAIVANPIETMDARTIEATVFLADGQRLHPGGILSKAEFAVWLLEQIPAITAAGRPGN